MKKLIVMAACSFVLIGCGQSRSEVKPPVGFLEGASRENVLNQLQQMHAAVLTNTAELVRAEFKTAAVKPMQVELAFHDGNLAKVNYIPQ